MKKKIEFEAIVRAQKPLKIGKINSAKLYPFIGKKVKVKVILLKQLKAIQKKENKPKE